MALGKLTLARVIRAGLVDHGHLEAFGIGLFGTRYIDMHAIAFAVAVRVEFGLTQRSWRIQSLEFLKPSTS